MNFEQMAVLVPTRGRPQNAARLMEAWDATTTGHAKLAFFVDHDDPALSAYVDLAGSDFEMVVGPRNGFLPRLNAAASRWCRNYWALGSIGDDHVPRTPGWDERIAEALTELGTGIAYPNDGWRGAELPTAGFFTSDVVRTLGYVAPPTLSHMFCDDCWKLWGQGIDRLTYLPDVLVEHMHPHVNKAANDALYHEANNRQAFEADHQAFIRYKSTELQADLDKLRRIL